jgi:hypothetical protein
VTTVLERKDPVLAQRVTEELVARLSQGATAPMPPAPGPSGRTTRRQVREAARSAGGGGSPPPPPPAPQPPPPPPSAQPPSGSSGPEDGNAGEEDQGGNVSSSAKKALYIVMGLVALLINQSFWAWKDTKKFEYNNTDAGRIELRTEQMKEERKLQEVLNEAPQGSRSQAVQPQASKLSLSDGATLTLPENASGTIQGPATVVFTDSGQRIKRISGGDYKIAVEDSGNIAWTKGYDASSPPMSTDEFLSGLQRVSAKGFNRHRVRLEVKAGSVINLQT